MDLNADEFYELLLGHSLKHSYKEAIKKIFEIRGVESFPESMVWSACLLIIPDSDDVQLFEAFLTVGSITIPKFDSEELRVALSKFIEATKRLSLHIMMEQNHVQSAIIAAAYRYYPANNPDTDENRTIRKKVIRLFINEHTKQRYLNQVWSPNRDAARMKLRDLALCASGQLPASFLDMMGFESGKLCEFLSQSQSPFSGLLAEHLHGKEWLHEGDILTILNDCHSTQICCSQGLLP